MIRKQACLSIMEHIACRAVPELAATRNAALPVSPNSVKRQVNKGMPTLYDCPQTRKGICTTALKGLTADLGIVKGLYQQGLKRVLSAPA